MGDVRKTPCPHRSSVAAVGHITRPEMSGGTRQEAARRCVPVFYPLNYCRDVGHTGLEPAFPLRNGAPAFVFDGWPPNDSAHLPIVPGPKNPGRRPGERAIRVGRRDVAIPVRAVAAA